MSDMEIVDSPTPLDPPACTSLSDAAENAGGLVDFTEEVPVEEGGRARADSETPPSPVHLRKRKPPSAGAAFDPSRCPQCGTGSMCSRCRASLEKEKEKTASAEREKEAAASPRPPPAAPRPAKTAAGHGKKSSSSSGARRPAGAPSATKPKEKILNTQKPAVRKPLAGAAARSHANKVNRLLSEQNGESDMSTSPQMFEFIQRFLDSCPAELIDSFVQVDAGEVEMVGFGNMTYRQLAQHIFGLRVEHVQRLVRPVLHRLMVHPKNLEMFNQPVDPVALGIPTYFDKIKNAMDLGTVKGRLQRGGYHNLDDCVAEISLVFDNATLFNPPGHVVHEAAKYIRNDFNIELAAVREKLEKEAERKANHACSLCQGSCCYLCGEKCLRVEPPILVCHGPCGQKIKKNCIYYVSRDGFMLWCQKCHSGLPTVAAEARGVGKRIIMKKDLLKRRLDEEVAESWVRCDTCQRWVHQVCALFNERYESLSPAELANGGKHGAGAVVGSNAGDHEETLGGCFECPLCKLKDAIGERVVVQPPPPSPPPPSPPPSSAPNPSPTPTPPLLPEPAPLLSPVVVQAPPAEVSISLHGRNRKKPAALRGGDFVVIPLKQSHVSRAQPALQAELSDGKKTKKRGRPEGSVNKVKASGAGKGRKNGAVGKQNKKIKLSAKAKVPQAVAEDVYIVPKLQGRRGRKPKFRVNLGRPEEFNTNLGYAEPLEEEVESDHDESLFESDLHNTAVVHCGSGDINEMPIYQEQSCNDDHISSDAMSANGDSTNNDDGENELSSNEQDDSASDSPVNDRMELDDSMEAADVDESEARGEVHPETAESSDPENNGIGSSPSGLEQQAAAPSAEDQEGNVRETVLPCHNKKASTLSELIENFGHRQWTAAGLPRSRLGDFLECLVREKLRETEKHAKVADTVYVRMISNTNHKLEVPAAVRDNFPNPSGYILPRFIPYRQKCIILFQRIQGNDISLFSLYVQEFDESCPEPNRSRVYVAYLDSIEYFRPRECRTLVYHEILAGYLKWAQARGFEHCHIWACPPQRGDNFIFWCHPPHQRTPSRDRLTSWYNQMLRRAGSLNAFSANGLKNAWAVFFRQYAGRDSSSQARTAGRPVSYVHSAGRRGRGGRRGGGSRAGRMQRVTEHSDDDSRAYTDQTDNHGNLHRSGSLESLRAPSENGTSRGTLVQPSCPPIFEGDFWVNECIRIHRFMENKAKSASTGLNAANAVTNAGPMADKIANHRSARDMMKRIMSKPLAYPFLLPVDHIALGIPDYPTIVKNPMDLGTIKAKLKSKVYPTLFEFAEDMRLTFTNSILYNPISHPIHVAAVEFLDMFTKLLIDFVSTKLGPNLTPALDASSGGLNVWLKNFQLTSCALENNSSATILVDGSLSVVKTVQNVNQEAVTTMSGEKVENLIENRAKEEAHSASHSIDDTGNDSRGGDDLVEEDVRMDAGSECDNRADDTASRRSGDDDASGGSDSAAELEADEISVGGDGYGNQYIMDDGEDDVDGEVTLEESKRDGSYPAPIGFCRQDSIVTLGSSFDGTSGSGFQSNSCDASLRTSTSLLQGSQMSTADEDTVGLVKQERRRPGEVGGLTQGDEFRGAALGLKGVCSLMQELSKAALRFKDDLFVIRLAGSPLQNLSVIKMEQDSSLSPKAFKRQHNTEISHVWREWLQSSGLNADVFLQFFNGVILYGNTADPDAITPSPFVDSRHAFLEMCQYRHYQFDSLRRAKHSSMMLLYHLHRPTMASLRPVCVSCRSVIKEIRWHCELCDHYDLCARCVSGKVGAGHQHPLIPFRVTYV